MPRLKRSAKRAAVAVAPEIRPIPRTAERLFGAHCPLCGRNIPQNRAIKIGYVTVDRVGYFGSIDWDPDKPFGVSFAAGGKGAFKDWRPIDPEDAPEFFEALKGRFIDALKEWLAKGWLTREEVESTLEGGE